MDNLLDLVKGQLTPDLIQKASGLVGESPAATGSALGALAPTLLSAVASKGSTADGASQLLGALAQNKVDDGLLGNVMGMLGGGESSNSLLSMGGPLVSMLLGNKSGGIMDLVANVAGVKSSSSGMLASLLMPIIGGLLSKQVKAGGLNPAGLASMLMGQKASINAAAPKGLDSLLDGFGGAASAVTGAAKGAADMGRGAVGGAVSAGKDAVAGMGNAAGNAAASVSGGMPKWLLPVILGLAALALLWFVVRPLVSGGGASAAACTAIGQVNLTQGLPQINANTPVADVKAWIDRVKPTVNAVVTAGRAAGFTQQADAVNAALTGLERVVGAVTTPTLGPASVAIQPAVDSINASINSVRTSAGCR